MNFNSSVFYLIFIAAGYLLGSILFGDFLLRKWHGVSIEEDWAAFNAFCRIYTCFLLPAVLAPSSHPCTSDTQHRYVYLPAWNVCEPSCAKISGLLHEWYSAEFSVCHLRTALQTNTAIIECKTSVCFDTLAFLSNVTKGCGKIARSLFMDSFLELLLTCFTGFHFLII